ncbi:MAG: SDR family NAD(P)-dependent oxidoreductase, partial [Holosporaceae bacterium]|nr:SDR family NAD(P)-dependent oxidoreductase [Holosporaceae bacterium]
MQINLFGKTALITGSTGHLGAALSLAFRMANANVIIQGRDQTKLNALEHELNKLAKPGFIKKIIADLSDSRQISKCTRHIKKFSVDILINNAATQWPIGILETNEPIEWSRSVSVNFIAPVKVGHNALIAAGSTVTCDVPSGKLAIARARQELKRRI